MLVLQHSSEQNHHNEFQQDVNLADIHSNDFCLDECCSTSQLDSKETKHPHDYEQNDIEYNDTWYNNTLVIKTLKIKTLGKTLREGIAECHS
jgi:hypothetical protein